MGRLRLCFLCWCCPCWLVRWLVCCLLRRLRLCCLWRCCWLLCCLLRRLRLSFFRRRCWLLAALLPALARAALLLSALLPLLAALLTPAAFLTQLPLAAFPSLALGLPLLPLLVPVLPLLVLLLLEVPVSWLPLSVAPWGPSPQRLSATQVSAQAKAPNLSLTYLRVCPAPMVPIPFAVAAAPPGGHIMPSLQPGLPISRSQRFKCHQSAVQGFSPYQLDALQAERGNEPPKASNLSLTDLRVPVLNGPNFFGIGCGAPWGTHNALTSTRTPH